MSYSDFGRQRQDVERVEGVGDIGQGDYLEVGLANCEVLELNFVRLGDEGFALKVLLLFGHVEPVHLHSLLFVLLFELGQFPNIQDLVSVLVILHKSLFFVLIHGFYQ